MKMLAICFVFLMALHCSTQQPSAPPGFKPKPFKVNPSKLPNAQNEVDAQKTLKTTIDTVKNAADNCSVLSPAEAHKKIFGNLDADKPEKVQKRIKELEKVRDMIAEYKELLAKKEAERGPPEPLCDETRQKLESMHEEVEAAKASRAKKERKEEDQEQNMNQELEGYVLEGDIIPTVEQMEDRLDHLKGNAPRNRSSSFDASYFGVQELLPKKVQPKNQQARYKRGLKNFANFPDNKWNVATKVYWMTGANMTNPTILSNIQAAFDFYQQTLCLYFERVTSPPPSPTPYILLQNGPSGICNSWVGRVDAPNVINLADGCVNSAPHEIGHALGLYHTQSRYDRDNFVEVHMENTNAGTGAWNFDPETPFTNDNLNVLYDYGSRMHYGAMDFYNATKGLPVLVAKEGHHQNTMGQRWGMAFSDHLMLNLAYCSNNCPAGQSGTAACKNGGYPNPNWCNQCLCPPGWSGTLCDQMQPATPNANCNGAIITANTTWQQLQGSVSNPSGQGVESCHWHIKVQNPGQKLSLWIDQVAPEGDDSCNYGCTNGDVEFKVANFTRTGYRMCCQSDLAPAGYVQINSPTGYAIINANTRYDTKAFSVWYIAY